MRKFRVINLENPKTERDIYVLTDTGGHTKVEPGREAHVAIESGCACIVTDSPFDQITLPDTSEPFEWEDVPAPILVPDDIMDGLSVDAHKLIEAVAGAEIVRASEYDAEVAYHDPFGILDVQPSPADVPFPSAAPEPPADAPAGGSPSKAKKEKADD